MSDYSVRQARLADIPTLPDIERRASASLTPYETLGSTEPGELEWFRSAAERAHLWVATDETDKPVAFALFEVLDPTASDLHLEEIDVDPAHARRGLGARLIQAAALWAGSRGYTGITLTTFRSVPWNAPYYERLGFRELPTHARPAPLAARVAAEASAGLRAHRRITMRLTVPDAPSPPRTDGDEPPPHGR